VLIKSKTGITHCCWYGNCYSSSTSPHRNIWQR